MTSGGHHHKHETPTPTAEKAAAGADPSGTDSQPSGVVLEAKASAFVGKDGEEDGSKGLSPKSVTVKEELAFEESKDGVNGKGSGSGTPGEESTGQEGSAGNDIKPEAGASAVVPDASSDGEGSEVSSPTAILAVALLLMRHALEDTFGEGSVKIDEGRKELSLIMDKARAKLRVYLTPVPPQVQKEEQQADEESRSDKVAEIEAAWRCEIVECSKDGANFDALRNQLSVLIERLRIAVSKS